MVYNFLFTGSEVILRVKEVNIQPRLAIRFHERNSNKTYKIGNSKWSIGARTSDSVDRVEVDKNCLCPQVGGHFPI